MKINVKKMFTFIFMICFLFTGCSYSGNKDTSSINIDEKNSSRSNDDSSKKTVMEAMDTYSDGYARLDFDERYEKIKNEYPDKTILIWADCYGMRYEEDVNKYLTSEKNSDYVICFKDYSEKQDALMNEDGTWHGSYTEELEKDLADNTQIDIISTMNRAYGYDSYVNAYKYYVSKGWFEPLEDYLSETEIGKKLKDSVSDNYWEGLKYNGKIYGFDNDFSSLVSSLGFDLNADVLEKQGLDVNELKGSYDSVLEKLLQYCKKNELKLSCGKLDNLNQYLDYDFLDSFLYIDENGKAKNIYENDKVKKLFSLLEKGYSDDCIQVGTPANLTNYLGEMATASLGAYSRNGVKTNDFYGLSVSSKEKYSGTCSYQVYPEKFDTIHSSSIASGVSSTSEHKDMAFDALATIMTDEKLNSIIFYGPDYKEVNGCVEVDDKDENYYYGSTNLDNMLVRKPLKSCQSPDMNKNIKDALDNAAISDYAGFYFDTSKVGKQILAVEDIVSSVNENFPTEKYNNAEKYLEHLNKQLYDAGLQDILDEANRQLEAYK